MSYLNTAFLSNLSGWELVLIFAVILLFFGAKRLPELSESLGKSLKRFKKATSEVEDEVRSALDVEKRESHNQATSKSKAPDECPTEENQNDSPKT